MSSFKITFNGTTVGYTEFEHGDPPMGVVFGRLDPLNQYSAYQAAFSSDPQSATKALQAFTPEGIRIEYVAMAIDDSGAEYGEAEIQVTLLGISNPPYSVLFPQHVALYNEQFPSAT